MRIVRWATFVGVSLLLAGCQSRHGTESHAPLGVEQLAKAPASYTDRSLQVRGVVSSVVPRKGAFTLIDVDEYKSCGELGCAAYEVPVAYLGTLPDTGQVVLVTGRLEQPNPGRYLVRADKVEREP